MAVAGGFVVAGTRDARNKPDELARSAWRRHPSLENLALRNFMAVEFFVLAAIRAKSRAIERDSAEQAARSRPGQNFRMHGDIRLRADVTSHGTGRAGRFTADREFIGHQPLHTFLI